MKPPSRQLLARVEASVRRNAAHQHYIGYIRQQGIDFDSLDEDVRNGLFAGVRSAFIHSINSLYDSLLETKVRQGEGLRKRNALLRYHFKVEPDSLSAEEWATLSNDIEWIIEQERKRGKI